MEIKANSTPIKYVLMLSSTDSSGVTGISSPTIYFSKNGSAATQLTGFTWSEVSSTTMPGLYKLTLTTSMTDQIGQLVYYVSYTGCDTYRASFDIVANLESDTKAVVDAVKTKVDTNLDVVVSTRASQTSLDNGVSTLNTEINQVSAEVWSSSSRTVTSWGSLVTDIINGIWNRDLSLITTFNSIGKLLKDNINATISSRADQTSVNNLPSNTWNYSGGRTLSSFGDLVTLIRDAIWTAPSRTLSSILNFAQEIWNYGGAEGRTLTQSVEANINVADVWNYTGMGGRTLTSSTPTPGGTAGVGAWAIIFNVKLDGVNSVGHIIRCYDVNKNPLFEVITDSNGIGTLNLDDGVYIIQTEKEGGIWTTEQSIVVSGANQNITIDTSTAVLPSYLTFKFNNKSKNAEWQIGEKQNHICAITCDQGVSFVIAGATYSVVDSSGNNVGTGNCRIDYATSTFWFAFQPLKADYFYITYTVNIGELQLKETYMIDVVPQ